MTTVHQPVLLKEAIEFLNIKPGEAYLDATLGGGGHAQAIIEAGGQLFGLDQDPLALNLTRGRLKNACPDGFWQLELGNFAHLKKAVQAFKVKTFKGILFDLGLSSDQLADQERGFSFQIDSPLDMRMDPELKVTAADLIKVLNKGELNELFKKLGEEQRALRIADAIVRAREQAPIKTTKQLADLIISLVSRQAAGANKGRRGKIHPATKVFQALRIAVNDELNNLKTALPQAVELLKPKGRLVVISFHGLEDGIVKRFFKSEKDKKLKILTKKPLQPSLAELRENRRSRSAKLRAAERL